MDQTNNDLMFKLMTLTFKLRDALLPRTTILQEFDLKPGMRVLDFGCGPGSYSLAAAEQVGQNGKVYALDRQPLALQYVRNGALKRGLTNIETIYSDGATHLLDQCIDLIFLFDIFHALDHPEPILAEAQRILKPNGLLCVNDHHLPPRDIITRITLGGRFKLKKQGKHSIQFARITY
jgi:ubiquinone/menaquinone biosynthesis C-methylase UbiE